MKIRQLVTYMLLLSSMVVSAQDTTPNTFVLHPTEGEPVSIATEEIDSLFVDGKGTDAMLHVRMKDHTLRTYVIDETSYMDFAYVAPPRYRPVNLGLSVDWATCNVGGRDPEDYGYLFSWGETKVKSDYSESQYTWYVDNTYQDIGADICGTDYDAATRICGSGWRMPSYAEAQELITRCTWTPDTLNNVSGYTIVGPSGNTIFLPAAGYKSARIIMERGTEGYYWTGSLSPSLPSSAFTINFRGYDEPWATNRAYGLTIRAVKEKQ
ncbi:MAG: hypothetical protein IJ607_06595 [Bacteroidaceae bacterium]|nr:hypothetical protein [Bacteroidaceae bacterium]